MLRTPARAKNGGDDHIDDLKEQPEFCWRLHAWEAASRSLHPARFMRARSHACQPACIIGRSAAVNAARGIAVTTAIEARKYLTIASDKKMVDTQKD